jgi:predicted HTH domain antitoxin
MTTTIHFDLPIDISASLHSKAEQQAKIAYIMTLLKHGEISSGVAGKLLGISRLEVLELMSQYGVTIFPEQSREELEREISETLELLENSVL